MGPGPVLIPLVVHNQVVVHNQLEYTTYPSTFDQGVQPPTRQLLLLGPATAASVPPIPLPVLQPHFVLE
jgi:hypothetical protein